MGRPKVIPTCHPDQRAGGRGLCKKCYLKQYNKEHKRDNTDHNARSRFNISGEEYKRKREQQGNLCGLCKLPLDDNVHLDHDHETGQLRDFIHNSCNLAIGLFKDDPTLCRLAAEYLERHKYGV
jgi:hypothetical protein